MKQIIIWALIFFIFYAPNLYCQPLSYNQALAIYVKGGGYIKYQEREYGINLEFTEFPVYEWELRQGNSSGTVKTGSPIALFNLKRNDYVIYNEREYGINLNWLKNTKEKNINDWMLEGNMNDPAHYFWLKNNTRVNDKAPESYIKNERREYGINLVWGTKLPECNIQFVRQSEELTPATLVADGGTWSFKNFNTNELDWDSFTEAFSIGAEGCDGIFDCIGEAAETLTDYINPLNYTIFFAANNIADKGNCFGMCLTAEFMAERGTAKLPYAGELKEKIWDYKDESKLRKAINVAHWKQLSVQFITPWLNGLNASYVSQAKKMKNDIQAGKFGLLSIYKDLSLTNTSGHLIIPYKVTEKTVGGKTEYWISVYDPNRPFTNLNNISENAYPPLIIKDGSFSYKMVDGSVWSDDMSYVTYQKAKDYDNLMNSLWDLGYVIISDVGELEQISDKNNRKLLKKANPSTAADFDFSANGLANDVFPMSFLDFGDGTDTPFFSRADSIPDALFNALSKQQQQNFGNKPLVLLVKKSDIQNLKIQTKTKSAAKQLWIGVGNAREFVEMNFEKGDSQKIQPEVEIEQFGTLSKGVSIRNRVDKEINTQFSFGSAQRSQKRLDVQDVKMPIRSAKVTYSQNNAREMRIAASHLKGQTFNISRTYTSSKGQKQQTLSKASKVD